MNIMKRLYYIFIALGLAVSCKVVDPYHPNPMTDINIINLSHNMFTEEAGTCLTVFYNAFHIARFLEADAEVKVSPEYDLIRTGISGTEGIYTFDYDEYTFTKEGLFEKGGACAVDISYHNTVTVNCLSEGCWQVKSSNGMMLDLEFIEENEDSMKMSVKARWTKTENSAYLAKFHDEGLQAVFKQKAIGELEALILDGKVIAEYYEANDLIKSCSMTFKPGLTTEFDVF